MTRNNQSKLSIVIPVFNEEEVLGTLRNRLMDTFRDQDFAYEIILVNDGSTDQSSQIIQDWIQEDERIILLELSRNFGHHRAMMTGLTYAKGNMVFLIDCDLEEEPEIIIPFYKKIEEEKADVIYGIQTSRKGNWWERLSGFAFYKLFNFLSSHILVPVRLPAPRVMRQHRRDRGIPTLHQTVDLRVVRRRPSSIGAEQLVQFLDDVLPQVRTTV